MIQAPVAPVLDANPVNADPAKDPGHAEPPTIEASVALILDVAPVNADLVATEAPGHGGPLINDLPMIEEAGDEQGVRIEEDEADYPGDEGIPTCANRRYPLRDRVPKIIKSMKAAEATISTSEPFEPAFYKEAMQCGEAHL